MIPETSLSQPVVKSEEVEEPSNSDLSLSLDTTSIFSDGELSIQEIQTYNSRKRFVVTQIEGARLEADLLESGKVLFHLFLREGFKFTKTSYKEMLIEFQDLMDQLRERGLKYVFVVVPIDEKLVKFEQMFGFKVEQVMRNPFEQDIALVMRRNT